MSPSGITSVFLHYLSMALIDLISSPASLFNYDTAIIHILVTAKLAVTISDLFHEAFTGPFHRIWFLIEVQTIIRELQILEFVKFMHSNS